MLTSNEVLIKTAYSAVNRADLLQAAGKYPPPPGVTDVLGLECTGTITEIGAAVQRWKVGDQVCALLAGGAYAPTVTVDAGSLLPIPRGLSVEQAAALTEVACTVWSNVFMIAGLRPGERFLVHGGGSGIGTMAIQLAKATGAFVAATARKEKHAQLRDLGADLLIDYQSEDFVEKVGTADVILDSLGADYLQRNIAALALNGRLAIIGTMGGSKAELDIAALMRKRAAITATTLRGRSLDEKAAICASVEKHVWPLVENGKVKPVIDKVFPLSQWKEAHSYVATNAHIGKVLLDTSN